MNENIEKYSSKNRFKIHIKFIIEKLIIVLKSLLEFKANLYSTLIINLFFYSTMFVFFSILYLNFGEEIGWSLSQFVFFITISGTIHCIFGLVFWKDTLFFSIIEGNLNKILFYPLNPFLMFNINTQNGVVIIFFFSNFLTFLVALIYFKTNPLNLVFILLFILLCFETLLMTLFIDSLDLIKLGSHKIFLVVEENLLNITKNYPSPIFKNLGGSVALLVFQGYFVGMVLVPILFGASFLNYLFEIGFLISLICLFALGTWINWHFGLKKYEAFG